MNHLSRYRVSLAATLLLVACSGGGEPEKASSHVAPNSSADENQTGNGSNPTEGGATGGATGGNTGTNTGSTGSTTGTSTTTVPPDACPYPSGPYGHGAGDIIEDLSFATASGGDYRLSGLRCQSGKKVLLLREAYYWCPTCQKRSPALIEMHRQYASQGLVQIDALKPDGKDELANWKSENAIPYDVVLDRGKGSLHPDTGFDEGYFGPEDMGSLTQIELLIRLDTMEVLAIEHNVSTEEVAAALAQN